MLDQLEAYAQRIPLDDLVPVRVAAELAALSGEELARPPFFPADETDEAVRWDINRSRTRVEIYCPFLHKNRVARFREAMVDAVRRGVKVTLFTRGPEEHPEHEPILRSLRDDEVEIVTRDQMHEKIVVVDDVLWHGSLNLFAQTRATELMMRIESPASCAEARRTVERAQPTHARRTPPMGARTYLVVPFAQKDDAKRLGAKWDPGRKSWYVNTITPDAALFARWLPPQRTGE